MDDQTTRTYCVYKHTSPSGKVYIGITSQRPQDRWNGGHSYWENKHFFNAIKRYGWKNFRHEILFDGLDKETACTKEVELIAQYRSNEMAYGYNRSTGGEWPASGVVVSEETKQKKSAALKGRTMPEKDRRAISEAKKGRSNGREGMTGAACPLSGTVYQIDETSGAVVRTYCGFSEAARLTGFARTPMQEAAQGKRKRAYGYLWRYEKRGSRDVII